MARSTQSILCLIICLFAFACANQSDTNEAVVVQWEALRELDELSLHMEGYVERNDMEHVRGHYEELRDALAAVAESELPENAHKPDEARQLQQELKALADSLTDELKTNDEMVKTLVKSVHPVSARLMEAAGVPHVHGHEGHDHDHEGHDH